MKHLLFALGIVLSTSSTSLSAEAKPPEAKPPEAKPPEVETAIKEFDKAKAELHKNYEVARKQTDETYKEEIGKLESKLLEKLEDARKKATVADKLDEALAIRQMITSFKDDSKEEPKSKPEPARIPTLIPRGAVAFQGHHYAVALSEHSWHEAKKICEDLGGHLVCINSAEEQKFVSSLLNPGTSYWTGGTDESSEGKWRWLDGEDFNYVAWAYPQPDNQRGYGDYLVIEGTASLTSCIWNDFHASGLWQAKLFVHGYVCEWDK